MSPRRAKAVRDQAGSDPAADLREHLIRTADRLLGERVVATPTTRDLAREAGVSDGVLYNYFADKNELLLTALVRRYAGMVTRFDGALPAPGTDTVEANLVTCLRACFDLQADAFPIAVGLVSQPALLHRFSEAIRREPFGPLRLIHGIADYLLGEQRLGRLPEADPVPAVTMLFGSTMMLAVTHVLGNVSRTEQHAHLPALAATLLRGLTG